MSEDNNQKECCDNCRYCTTQRGYGIGEFEYWCKIQNGQKSKYYCCGLYEKEQEMSRYELLSKKNLSLYTTMRDIRIKELKTTLKKSRTVNQELIEALSKYGHHRINCAVYEPDEDGTNECSCGFTEILTKHKGGGE